MKQFFGATPGPGHLLVHFHDNRFGLVGNGPGSGDSQSEIKVAVFVHRRHHKHGHIHRQVAFTVKVRFIPVEQGNITHQTLVVQLTVQPAEVPAAHGKDFPLAIGFNNFRHPQADSCTHLDIGQLFPAPGQSGVQCHGRVAKAGIVDLVSRPDNFNRLIRRDQFLPVHPLIIH